MSRLWSLEGDLQRSQSSLGVRAAVSRAARATFRPVLRVARATFRPVLQKRAPPLSRPASNARYSVLRVCVLLCSFAPCPRRLARSCLPSRGGFPRLLRWHSFSPISISMLPSAR